MSTGLRFFILVEHECRHEKCHKTAHCVYDPVDAANNKVIPYGITEKLWKTLEASIFTINNSDLFCVVDYHSKYFVVKWVQGLQTKNLIKCYKIFFAECGIPKGIESDAEANSAKN